jgi:predicted nucleic acid-binding protein
VELSGWLIDKSALVRLGDSLDADEWISRIGRGLVHITKVTLLEVGFSARNADALQTVDRRPPLSSMPIHYLTPAIENRAAAVQLLLAERGHHRAASIPDLLIAATAELIGFTMLHVDKDFELIAEVTGQPVERLRV